MPGADDGTMYIDDIYLVKQSDISNFGLKTSSITVTGDGGVNSIVTDKGTLQMNALVLPVNGWIKTVEWSVSNGTGKAVIDKNGLLTALSDGTVIVYATARDGSYVFGSLNINITNQVKSDYPIDFETIADINWSVFANGTGRQSDFQIVGNPKKQTKNNSEKVLKFVVNADADPRAGAYSDAFTPIEFTCNSYILTMMVNKSGKSPVGVKVEQSTNGGPDIELKSTNKVINGWEQLSFNFYEAIGHTYPRIRIFPDYPETRTAGSTTYLDNIALQNDNDCVGISNNEVKTIMIFPNPVGNELNIYLNSDNADIIIYNSIGVVMENIKVQGMKAKFDVSSYTHGVYFVEVNNNSVVKFVK
jgi:hypothetical protein